MEFGILVAVETILRKMTTFKESAAIGLVTSYLRVLSFALLLLMLYSVFFCKSYVELSFSFYIVKLQKVGP